MSPHEAKYLQHYAESEVRHFLQNATQVHGDHFLAVPLCAESRYLPFLVESLEQTEAASDQKIVVAFVINQRASATSETKTDNEATRVWLRHYFSGIRILGESPPLWTGQRRNITAIIVERLEGAFQFADSDGVGLARKIGADIGLALKVGGFIRSDFLHNTDGDARLPVDYFNTSRAQDDSQCLIYGFRHFQGDANEATWTALKVYEMWLRYYRLGLARARSPYAIHTIGSLIAVRASAYAQVRGFPKRQAAEDFYLVNKLIKVGPCQQLQGGRVAIACRESLRVPFGTGKGTLKVMELLGAGRELEVLDPQLFNILGDVLTLAEQSLCAGDGDRNFGGKFSNYPVAVQAVIESWSFENVIAGALGRSRSWLGAVRQFHDWFDGFRTMKFLHQLRDHALPSIPLSNGLRVLLSDETLMTGFSDVGDESLLHTIRLVDESYQNIGQSTDCTNRL